jgi:cation diffusion facilitator family transporter
VGDSGISTRATERRRKDAAAGRPARQASRRAARDDGGASRRTVLVALAANAVIAVTKLAGGLLSGSPALLAEAAHSVADTTNQGFLLASIALSQRRPSEDRPFGHGEQRFLWSFIAAIGMFLAGALFALGYGVMELLSGPKEEGGFAIAWITLAIALVAEGTSWVRAMRQTKGEAQAAGKPVRQYIRESRDPSVKMVLFEDSAALAGLALAAAGIGLHQLTGVPAWDPIASVVIGVLLIAVAGFMARDAGGLLVGASARPDERAAIEDVLEGHPGVVEVTELLTLVLGPRALLVAARLDLVDTLTAAEVEHVCSELDDAIGERVPDATEVFLDATPGRR